MRHHGRAEDGARHLRGDDGAAAVEFALILPVLALIVCGVIDLGRWYSAWNETKNAAREGALYAQTHPNQQTSAGGGAWATPNNITDRVTQELGTAASSAFQITISPPVATCNPTSGAVASGQTLTVTVKRSVPLITPILRNIISNGVTINADVKVTVQG